MNCNRVTLGNFLNNDIPDHWADVIIADPPYYKVKGEFDEIWPSFEAYLADVEKWAKECARILSHSGTLVWYGSDQNIAYAQVILDKYFHFLNNCTVLKSNGLTNKIACIEDQRAFIANSERFLLYENNSNEEAADGTNGLLAKNVWKFQLGQLHTETVKPVIDYLVGEKNRAGVTSKEINEYMGNYMSTHWFAYSSQFQLPSREAYEKLRVLFNSKRKGGAEILAKPWEFLYREYDDLRAEYNGLKGKYDDLRRPFHLTSRQTDVFVIVADCGASKRFGHPTSKDLKLTLRILSAIKRDGGTVFVPFGGSGTECVAAKLLGLTFAAYELDPTYCENANKRIAKAELKRSQETAKKPR